MGVIQPKAEWVDSTLEGKHECKDCSYRSNSEEHLQSHREAYHPSNSVYILYMGCNGSIDGREGLNNRVDAEWIDCTGGQTAYKDGDFNKLGEQLVQASRETGVKLYHVYRMYNPGLGLDFPMWWVQGGIDAGVFQQYSLPEDVMVKDE